MNATAEGNGTTGTTGTNATNGTQGNRAEELLRQQGPQRT